MKKLISIVLIALSAMSVFVMPVSANAAASKKVYKSGNWKYVTSAKASKIVKYVGKGGKVTIPSKLGGKPVTGVAHNSFDSSNITSVKFPKTVKAIGDRAFDSCFELKSVKLSNGLKSIGEYAFQATNLKSVKLPDSVTKIGAAAFSDCEKLSKVTLSKNITEIPDSCFVWTAIKSFTTPAACKKIGSHAFEESKLQKITLGKNLKVISDDAFYFVCQLNEINVSKNNPYYCSKNGVLYNKKMTKLVLYPFSKKAKEFTVPATVKSIGDKAFYNSGRSGYISLKKVNLPKGLKRIGDYAFAWMETLREAKIPSTVEYIGDEAFYETHLTSVKIPKSVKSIGHEAFSYTRVETISVNPNPELEIGEKVFAGNYKLTKVTLFPAKDSYGYTYFYCSRISEVVIPDNVKTIYEHDFYGCGMLTTVTIPSTVKKIEAGAFGYDYGDDGSEEIEGFTIRGKKGSEAERYAKYNGFKFEEI